MDRFIARLQSAVPEIDRRTLEAITSEYPETARAVGTEVIATVIRAADEHLGV